MDDQNILRLVPKTRQEQTQKQSEIVARLRELLAAAEAGEFEEFTFVAVLASDPKNHVRVNWTTAPTFALVGAVATALQSMLSRTVQT